MCNILLGVLVWLNVNTSVCTVFVDRSWWHVLTITFNAFLDIGNAYMS